MGKLFRKALFGGFRKKDVITYLENTAAQRKEEQQTQEGTLRELNAQTDDLRQQLQAAESGIEALQQLLVQAQDHAAALRREADNAENRGAEARVRVQELEGQLTREQEEKEMLQSTVAQLSGQVENMEALSQQNEALTARCTDLQAGLDAREQILEEQADGLAYQQAEYDKLQKAYTALLQQRQEMEQRPVVQESRVEELLYLRREIERMRDSYDALMRQMLGCNLRREPVQADTADYRNLLEKMDRALMCLEQLVACKECRAEESAAKAEAPVKEEPAKPAVKESVKKAVTLEEILKLVRSKK